jgi:allophanate hydrolase
VLARLVGPAALAVDAAAAFDPADPWSRRPPRSTPAPGPTLRVGVPGAPVGLDRPAVEAWRAALDALGSLGLVGEVDLTAFVEAGELLYGGALVAARWHAFGEFLAAHPDGADPTVAAIVDAAAALPAHHLVADIQHLRTLARRFETVWSTVDVLAVPSVGIAPTLDEVARDPIGVNASLGRWTAGANLLDLCAVAAPCGWRGDGVPFGVTFLGPAFADELVLAAAARLLGEPDPPSPGWAGWANLVVVGAHLRGQPLNGQLTGRGGRFVREVMTARCYRLYALATEPPKPGLVRVEDNAGRGIAGELWALPVESLGELVRDLAPPLAIGTVVLDDGSAPLGFVCEAWAAHRATDITVYSGWIAYLRTGPT